MPSNRDLAPRDFYTGVAIGQFWLALVGGALVWMTVASATVTARLALGSVTALVSVSLLAGSVLLVLRGLRIPRATSLDEVEQTKTIGRTLLLRFAVVLILEISIIGGADAALQVYKHEIWTTPVTFFLVGLHFIPLAIVFEIAPYFTLGVAWMLVSALTVATVPSSRTMSGYGTVWSTLPPVGCGVATWVIVAYVLWANAARVSALIAK